MPRCTPIKGARPNSAAYILALYLFLATMVKRVIMNKEGYHLVHTRDLPKAEATSQAKDCPSTASGFGN